MKKVLRTFLITLILVLYAGIAGIIYVSQTQPEKVQQFLGCPTTTQLEMQEEIQTDLDSIEAKLNTMLPQVEILFEQQFEDDEEITDEPTPRPQPIQEDVEQTPPTIQEDSAPEPETQE